MAISLNIPQERELARLIDYERSTCSVEGELVYRCAFPYRPDDELQAELIDAGALAADGYSFFLERNRAERERVRREKRDARLIGLSALFAELCVVAGFLLGRFLA